jgi:hypothetical protein
MPYTKRCRASVDGCPAFVMFAKQNPTDANPRPAPNPLDTKPDRERGNLRLDLSTMTYDVLTGEDLTAARERGEDLFLSHFVTCEFRNRFRKKKGGKK